MWLFLTDLWHIALNNDKPTKQVIKHNIEVFWDEICALMEYHAA